MTEPHKRGERWSRRQIEQIVRRYNNGWSMSDLAKLYNCTLANIHHLLDRCGVQFRGKRGSLVGFAKYQSDKKAAGGCQCVANSSDTAEKGG